MLNGLIVDIYHCQLDPFVLPSMPSVQVCVFAVKGTSFWEQDIAKPPQTHTTSFTFKNETVLDIHHHEYGV
jgi:hypothetical protein